MAEGRTTQEQLSSNSLPIATIHNATRRKRQRAIQVVATHPAADLSKTIKQDVDQNVNTSSKRSTAESRFNGRVIEADTRALKTIFYRCII